MIDSSVAWLPSWVVCLVCVHILLLYAEEEAKSMSFEEERSASGADMIRKIMEVNMKYGE